MATGQTYPKISRKIWWLVRERLKKSMPSTISPTLITALAQMTDASARANVISPLRDLGLLDDNAKPTPLAERWRHDDEYNAVCHEIRSKIYPHELIEAFPDPDPDKRDSIKSWFMKVGQVGENAAHKYTDTYLLLSEGTPSKAVDKPAAAPPRKEPTATAKAKSKTVVAQKPPPHLNVEQAVVDTDLPVQMESGGPHRRLPAIHIDVQVHISPDTPPDQIDRIFESMAKHLGGFIK